MPARTKSLPATCSSRPHPPICSCGATGSSFEDMSYAELLWVDYLGCYIKSASQQGEVQTLRVPFLRPVADERDARSVLTMMAQVRQN